ncbi:hypothetical protein J5837_07845 [Pseudoxanthomonas helianthi]|uniref:Uncharacterized protein n=1 Tax=Pseudoxanthomonas helianthi TaxID=1453541 RepID=A0A940X480_9GAMM|nr:hypothetical protein [Pseudoxanthomonas helianthi]MBP3984340.1 hypothetical protein [Pseudoxanthomonas helianthi]
MPADSRKRRKGRRPDYIVRATAKDKRGWWSEVPWWWLGVAAFIGFPMLRDATSDKMQRNRYADEASCRCDYGDRCDLDWNQENGPGKWVGPWYASNDADRRADDPGMGACRTHGGGYRSGYVYRDDGYRGPASVERGYRGGFGGTGRVRAAGS